MTRHLGSKFLGPSPSHVSKNGCLSSTELRTEAQLNLERRCPEPSILVARLISAHLVYLVVPEPFILGPTLIDFREHLQKPMSSPPNLQFSCRCSLKHP